jgi:hypothetical protein
MFSDFDRRREGTSQIRMLADTLSCTRIHGGANKIHVCSICIRIFMRQFLLFALVAAILTGCGTPTRVSNVEPAKGGTASYEIQAAVLGENPEVQILSAYVGALTGGSSYFGVTNQEQISAGITVSRTGNIFKVDYIRQNKGGTLKNDFHGEFVVAIARSGETYSVKVACPTSITNDVNMPPGMNTLMPWAPFIPKEKVMADLNAMCATASMSFGASENGEITTEFKESAVLANFARKFDIHNTQFNDSDPLKNKTFSIKEGNKVYEVTFSVFPYRNGSKVIYQELHAVKCAPSQACVGFDPSFASRLRDKMTAVAND